VVKDLDDALKLLTAERDENTCRKDFTPSEALSVGAALEALEGRLARQQQQTGKSADGKAGGRGRKKKPSGESPEGLRSKRETSAKAAKAVGMSRSKYEKAKAVKKAAEEDPERMGDLVEQMDRTGNVNATGTAEELRAIGFCFYWTGVTSRLRLPFLAIPAGYFSFWRLH
jgi:hypothetical protein